MVKYILFITSYALILNEDPTVNLHLPPVGLVNIVEHLKYERKVRMNI